MRLRLERRRAVGQGVGTFGLTFQLVGEPHKPIEEILPSILGTVLGQVGLVAKTHGVISGKPLNWSMRSTTAWSISLRRTR